MLTRIRNKRPTPACWQSRFAADRALTILDSPEVPTAAPADNDLKQRLVNYLHLRQVLDIQELEIEVHDGQVTVHGQLPSPQAKRLCLECCRRVAGVLRLKDELDVFRG